MRGPVVGPPLEGAGVGWGRGWRSSPSVSHKCHQATQGRGPRRVYGGHWLEAGVFVGCIIPSGLRPGREGSVAGAVVGKASYLLFNEASQVWA